MTPQETNEDGLWPVIGLGNPGPEYAMNRHNVGFMVLDVLAARVGGRFRSQRKTRCDVLEGRLAGRRIVLAKPRSYMNLSGGPVTALLDYYKVPLERVTIVHDELDLPFGTLRVKHGGGDNGHNGLRSVTGALGRRDYFRVRFGIGRPPGRMDPAVHVLRDFSVTERKQLDVEVERAADAAESLLRNGLAITQNAYHAT